MQVKRGWPLIWILLLAIGLGLGLGLYTTERRAQAVDQQVLFQAVHDYLTAAGVTGQDLPKAVIKVTTLPNGHYLVEMQMVVGKGWFEVWHAGGRWQVKGAPPP